MSFAERLKIAIKQSDLNQKELAQACGISPQAISNIVRGINEGTTINRANKMADALGVRLEWLLNGEEPMLAPESNVSEVGEYRLWSKNDPLPEDEYVQIPFYKDVEFQGGDGRDPVNDSNGFTLAFAKSTLYGQGVPPNKAICITLSGDSMDPIMPNGTTCGVNTDDKTIVDGKYYAINHGGLLRIKRLYRMPNSQIKINSINSDEYPDEVANLSDIEVVGRIFHVSVLL